jgi:hypothetical protein
VVADIECHNVISTGGPEVGSASTGHSVVTSGGVLTGVLDGVLPGVLDGVLGAAVPSDGCEVAPVADGAPEVAGAEPSWAGVSSPAQAASSAIATTTAADRMRRERCAEWNTVITPSRRRR